MMMNQLSNRTYNQYIHRAQTEPKQQHVSPSPECGEATPRARGGHTISAGKGRARIISVKKGMMFCRILGAGGRGIITNTEAERVNGPRKATASGQITKNCMQPKC